MMKILPALDKDTRNVSDLEFVAEFLPNSYAGFKEVYDHIKAIA